MKLSLLLSLMLFGIFMYCANPEKVDPVPLCCDTRPDFDVSGTWVASEFWYDTTDVPQTTQDSINEFTNIVLGKLFLDISSDSIALIFPEQDTSFIAQTYFPDRQHIVVFNSLNRK